MARSNMQRGRLSLILALSVFVGHRVTDFAQRGAPQSRAPQKGMTPKPRSQLQREVLEIKDPEPEVVREKVELPERRVPYTMSCYVHSDGPRHEESSPNSINFKYMVKKIQAALQSMEDWIMSVDVRMNIVPHQHAHQHIRKAEHGAVAASQEAKKDAGLEDVVPDISVVQDHKRELAPFRMEVTVKMGKDLIVLSGDKHAKPSFTEAVDHVHDILRTTMIKEHEKRIKMMRKARDVNNEAVSSQATDWDEEEVAEAEAETPEPVEEESQGAYELVDFEAVEKEEAEQASAAATAAAAAPPAPASTQAKSSGSESEGDVRDMLLR